MRYVERNPVAAKLCQKPAQWRWSSAKAQLQGKDDKLLRVQPKLQRIADWESYLAEEEKALLVETIERHSRTGNPLGDSGFIDKLEKLTGRELKPQKPGPKPLKDS